MNIDKLVNEVIPPSDYQHRNGFDNIPIIDKLADNEKQLLERALVKKMLSEAEKEIDTLIVDTLAHLKSAASLPVLRNLLEVSNENVTKLRIATAIFVISRDAEMVNVAVNSVKEMDSRKEAYYVYKLASAFYYLAKFKTEKTEQLIKEYASHSEYLISYNAKQALEI
jgi:HEAT repeat protein